MRLHSQKSLGDAYLFGADLSAAELCMMDLRWANLIKAIFQGAIMPDVKLRR